jgi:UDP-glucuronate 4-epimerase
MMFSLKRDRLAQLTAKPEFSSISLIWPNRPAIAQLFDEQQFEIVVNLAAQQAFAIL